MSPPTPVLLVRGQHSPFPTTPAGEYPEQLASWSDEHTARWLAACKCAHHADVFRAHDLRGDVLLELELGTLKEVGIVSVGERLRIYSAVKSLRRRARVGGRRPAPLQLRPLPQPTAQTTAQTTQTAIPQLAGQPTTPLPPTPQSVIPHRPPRTHPRTKPPRLPQSHIRNGSASLVSPTSSSHKLPPRPATTPHPYANPSALSSIEERSPRSPFHPTLDEIKRKLVKFVLFDHGLSYTIDVASCSTAIDVLEKVLRKKAGANPHDGDPPLLHAYTANGGLTVDGWGVYLDFGQQDGPGASISLSFTLSHYLNPRRTPHRGRTHVHLPCSPRPSNQRTWSCPPSHKALSST